MVKQTLFYLLLKLNLCLKWLERIARVLFAGSISEPDTCSKLVLHSTGATLDSQKAGSTDYPAGSAGERELPEGEEQP